VFNQFFKGIYRGATFSVKEDREAVIMSDYDQSPLLHIQIHIDEKKNEKD
jgi:hypothetical protein